jgi:hypothetical protein
MMSAPFFIILHNHSEKSKSFSKFRKEKTNYLIRPRI